MTEKTVKPMSLRGGPLWADVAIRFFCRSQSDTALRVVCVPKAHARLRLAKDTDSHVGTSPLLGMT